MTHMPPRCRSHKDTIIAVLEDGDDFFQSLDSIIAEHKIRSGIVLFGIGMLRDFELGYFDGTAYEFKKYNEPHEAIALHGTIAEGGIHIHAGLSGPDHVIKGGHLNSATVNVTLELSIMRLDTVKMERKINPENGLGKLYLE